MANRFDRIIKENFNGLTISLLNSIMGVEKVEVLVLPRKVQRTLEREMDTLLKVKPRTGEAYMLNVEWQVDNDSEMCDRMLLYHAMTRVLHKLPVRGLVIYMGQDKMNMPASIKEDGIRFSYQQIDLKTLSPERFLKSDIPGEIILAVLAGKTTEGEKTVVIKQILIKLRTLLEGKKSELERKIAQLEIIGELRGVQKIIKEEEQHMAFTYNLKNDIRYKEGLEVGMEKGIKEGVRKTAAERNTAFVIYLLKHTDHSDQEIADLVNVSLDFVLNSKKKNRKSNKTPDNTQTAN